MLRSIKKKIPLASLLLLGGMAFADTITVPGGTANFDSWSTGSLYGGTVNNPFTHGAYWNNSSFDGANKNIGYCLTSSNCGLSTTFGTLSYLGNSNGSAVNNFYFNNVGGGVVTMWLQIAQNVSYDTIGWYNVLNPSQTGVIFSGANATGTTVNFTPSAEYGLYLTDSAEAQTFYTNSSLNSAADSSYQHFAVFNANGSYVVAGEDLPASKSDFDYNDVVIQIASVPEPSSMFLLASGLLGLGLFRARRKKNSVA
jgi:hypothetical protein